MIPLLKSEARKLLSVRSTYVMGILALLIVAGTSFWVEGYKGMSGSPASVLGDKAVEEIFRNSTLLASAAGTFVAVLYMAHEYRYNIIMYTLTAANSRSKVLLAKILTLVWYTVAFTAICGLVGFAGYYLGLSLRDASLPAQNIDWLYMTGRVLFYNIGQILIALLITVLTRSIVAAIAFLFLFSSTVEPLLGIILKEKAAYLPFSAFERVISAFGGEAAQTVQGELSVGRAVVVCSVYLVVGWLITWQLFLRRDAN
ncbi:MAG TPA: ABC transporter permease [Candidatus Limnocylindria bacterium]|nr:ABC transporter permease [Candidatus Limnocylindria bacterium]